MPRSLSGLDFDFMGMHASYEFLCSALQSHEPEMEKLQQDFIRNFCSRRREHEILHGLPELKYTKS